MEKYSAFRVSLTNLEFISSDKFLSRTQGLVSRYDLLVLLGFCSNATPAVSDTSPSNRIGGPGQGCPSIWICNRIFQNSTCSCFGFDLRRTRSWCLLSLGKYYAWSKICKYSWYQAPVPPLYRLVTGLLTSVISRLILLLVGVWWIPVELVTRKRGQAYTLPVFCLRCIDHWRISGGQLKIMSHGNPGQEMLSCLIGFHG